MRDIDTDAKAKTPRKRRLWLLKTRQKTNWTKKEDAAAKGVVQAQTLLAVREKVVSVSQ